MPVLWALASNKEGEIVKKFFEKLPESCRKIAGKLPKFCLVVALFLSTSIFSTLVEASSQGVEQSLYSDAKLCDWPVPTVKIDEFQITGTSKALYDKVLNQVERIYAPIFRAKGYQLKIVRSWSDGTVNAQAWWSGNTCNVEMFGGLARWPGITSTAVRQVALHEIGHCLGGSPYYPWSTMSCEGQADYYSTLVGCRELGVGCVASSLNLARALASMGGEPAPRRPGPQLPAVGRTYCEHPEAQCRLQTYDAGIARGSRPRCWFK